MPISSDSGKEKEGLIPFFFKKRGPFFNEKSVFGALLPESLVTIKKFFLALFLEMDYIKHEKRTLFPSDTKYATKTFEIKEDFFKRDRL